MIRYEIGRTIQSMREKKGWSRSFLARKIASKYEIVYYIEKRQSNPTLETLSKYAYALDTTVEEILRRSRVGSTEAKKEEPDVIASGNLLEYFENMTFWQRIKFFLPMRRQQKGR